MVALGHARSSAGHPHHQLLDDEHHADAQHGDADFRSRPGSGWQADQSRLFHLVVDELHTYRGTPGTEVAYLIRVLLDRLGLTPDSSQLRIIASSASLTSDAAGLDYLEAFFGRDRNHFQIIGGNTVTPDPASVQTLGDSCCGFA